MTYNCPVSCGSGPFSTENGAVMHAVNMEDSEHSDVVDKRTAYDALNRESTNQETADDLSGSQEDVSGDRSDNPTMGSADPTADVTEPDTEEPMCKDCGGELFDFRQFDSGEYHLINGHNVYVRGDYQCSECAKWWVDE